METHFQALTNRPICFLRFHHLDPLNFSSELFSWQQVPFSSVLCPSDKNQNNTQKTLALEAIKPPLGILFSVFLNLFSKNSLREFVSDWMSLAYGGCNGLWALCSTTIEGLWTLKLIRRKEGEKPSNLILLSLQVTLLCRIYRAMGWYNSDGRNGRCLSPFVGSLRNIRPNQPENPVKAAYDAA